MAKKNPTRKQKNLAKLTLENPTMEKKELVALGGYGNSVQHTPAKALESNGYLLALDEYGLTEELLTTSLVSDIKAKPKNRVSELRLGTEIRGMTKQDKDKGNTTNIIFLPMELIEKHNLKNATNSIAEPNS